MYESDLETGSTPSDSHSVHLAKQKKIHLDFKRSAQQEMIAEMMMNENILFFVKSHSVQKLRTSNPRCRCSCPTMLLFLLPLPHDLVEGGAAQLELHERVAELRALGLVQIGGGGRVLPVQEQLQHAVTAPVRL